MTTLSNLRELDLEIAPMKSGGSAAARFGALFREHVQFVARSLRRLGVPDSNLDDAVQEVFVTALRKIDTITEGFERSFLYGTAVRAACNVHRVDRRAKTRRAEALSEDQEAGLEPWPTAEELIDRRDARAALDEILQSMPVEMRTVFTLFELEEMTISEIASMLGVPAGTVGSRLARAREQFDQRVRALQAQIDRREREP